MFSPPSSPFAGMGSLLRWTLLALPVAVLAGSASALFLWLLDQVTRLQWQHPHLLWFLPLGGVAVGWLYHHCGKGSDKGNNLLIDEIHKPGGGVPTRMAPLVLIGTLVTHLFGGSAGRAEWLRTTSCEVLRASRSLLRRCTLRGSSLTFGKKETRGPRPDRTRLCLR